MTARELEQRLLALSEAWGKRQDAAARAEYQRLHPVWLAMKSAERQAA